MAGLFTVLLNANGCTEVSIRNLPEVHQRTTNEQIQPSEGHLVSTGSSVHLVVPFVPDDTDQCGPATLASVLMYWDVPIDLQILKDETYRPQLKGTLPIDLVVAAQARGLRVEGGRGTLEILRTELDAGHPLVAFLNLGWKVFPQGHYVVITGYDEVRQAVYMHSGLRRDVLVSYSQFLADWAKTGRWMLLVRR